MSLVTFKTASQEANDLIQNMYAEKCNHPSDINELLPTIKEYADKCDTVCELGVRTVVASWAFLASKAKTVYGYDIQTQPEVKHCKAICEKADRDWRYIEADVLRVEIPEVDFLFIDTFHTYSQLKSELSLHAKKAKRFIGFHDTTTYEFKGEDSYEAVAHNQMNCGRGLWPAIDEFLKENKSWKIVVRLTNNNGLTILEKNG